MIRDKSPLIAAAFALALVARGSDVEACGGLFCNAAQPVNQAAERIIFADNDDGTVSAVIEIQYEGPASEFAWVLPVPQGEVEVGVGSKISLDRIEAQSNPTYRLSVTFDPECGVPDPAASDGSNAGAPPPRSPSEEDDGVTVVASGTVGPYDYEIISVDPDQADAAQAAVDWLLDNDYDVGELGPDVLRPYLEQEMNLIAFRLTKGSDVGSIRPVRLVYESEQPFIPLRPTAVAANPDMGIKVWVLGSARAVPETYLHLELNEARINWFSPGSNYDDVVSAAADEAGGQGFVTEQAGPAGAYAEAAYASWEEDNWEVLRTGQFSSLQDFLEAAVSNFGTYDGFIDVLRDATVVPLRDGATPEQFLSCVSCYFQTSVPVRNEAYPSTEYDEATDPLLDMDVSEFLAKVNESVIVPLADTKALFEDNSTVTRFYTTMSASEMTVDPAFLFNPDLEDVDNNHVADQVMQCSGGNEWRVQLASGIVVEGNGRTWPVTGDSDIPFNLRVLQLSTSGEGVVVEDNVQRIASQLTDLGIGGGEPVSPGDEDEDPADPDPAETDDEEAGATDSETDDAETDAESGADAGVSDTDDDGSEAPDADAGAPGDASTGGSDDGCGCVAVGQAPASSAPSWLVALLGLGLALRRRR